jgi:cytochrome c1
MKAIILKVFAVTCSALMSGACHQSNDHTLQLQAQIDSLKDQWKKSYVPGTGELMTNIQMHHAKLWFAGKNSNWLLAEYQESLIRSGFRKIQQYHGQKPEAKLAAMIEPAMDSVERAIHEKNAGSFKRQFEFMTSSCNSCHQATNHPYNVIVIPSLVPLDNQRYK